MYQRTSTLVQGKSIFVSWVAFFSTLNNGVVNIIMKKFYHPSIKWLVHLLELLNEILWQDNFLIFIFQNWNNEISVQDESTLL